MADVKLVYFDLRARGEVVRLVLEAAGKKYEDVRVSYPEQWPEEKPKAPYGQLPYVVYNGKKYGQSIALASFFAREYGLYGKSSLDALRVDEVAGLSQDLINALYKAKFEPNEEKKSELYEKVWAETAPTFLGFFQTLLQENGSTGFFVGTTVSLADLIVYTVTDSLVAEKTEIKDTFPPEVKKVRSNVEAHPFIRMYLAKRKDTPF